VHVIVENDPGNTATSQQERRYAAFENGQILLLSYDGLYGRGKASTIRLDARPLHCLALGRVQHPVVYGRCITSSGDHAVKGVDLPDQMAFAQSANGRITRHGPNRSLIEGDKRRSRAASRADRRRLNAGVSATDHDYVKHDMALDRAIEQVKIVPRGTSFSYAELPEQRIQNGFRSLRSGHRE